MRKFLLSTILSLWAGVALAQGIGAPNPILCNQTTQGTGTVAIATAIIGRNIVVCGWDVNANVASGAFSLIAGTGGTCATPTKSIVVWTALPTGAFIHHPTYAFTQAPSGSDLCVSVATTVSWVVSWGQF